MQFTKIALAMAAVAASVFAEIDWHSDATVQCSKANWAAIKANADPMIPMAPLILSPEQKKVFDSIMNGATEMPANPSDDFIRALPDAIPVSILDQTAGKIIEPCLATATAEQLQPSEEQPSEQPSGEPQPSEEPQPSGEPQPSEEQPSEEQPSEEQPSGSSDEEVPSSTAPEPTKCVPRN